MTYHLDEMAPRDRYRLLTGAVVPRPIGWISTVDESGRRNLAPFSYFNIAAANPPTLMYSGGVRQGTSKDTVRNARATGGFVAHIVDEPLLEAMNRTSVDAPPGVDEFGFAGLEAVPSDRVAAPRVAAAPVAFECELVHEYEVSPGGSTIQFGRVLVAHVRDDVTGPDGRIDVHALRPLARLAGAQYATLGEVIERARPVWETEGDA